jgi:hypothetical protein
LTAPMLLRAVQEPIGAAELNRGRFGGVRAHNMRGGPDAVLAVDIEATLESAPVK